ncbi:CHAT domain-containing protein [Planktothricoides raciborskii]|uniref:CHAT domain-containing protein n=1 Tax=Planktothricoides raciborskii GIHE-MW2 TaxID=2792601 RepID=A0AAU8JHV6_9CYAN
MNYQNQAKIKLISGVIIASTTLTIPVNAQPITPAADGTGTIVNQQDNIINITGGQTSSNGANLFHSFDQFGVNTGQTANFQSSPEINNILGRVVGGNASIINGILQVTGGNSNLFLMNPAGILFGPNASLNVPADFTATTATSIGFGNNNWFQSIGDNNWANLVGNPIDFSFDLAQPGWVVNFGDLTLNSGQNLTLLGGGILNSGNLNVPGGNISIAAVPGESIVRISQPGNILSLDIATPGLNQGVINPLSLPELLTGGSQILDATQVQHNADGTITLTSSAVTIDPNTDTGLVLPAGEINVAAETGGQVNIFGEKIALIGTEINANGINNGGTVLIGGDYQGNGIVPNASQTFVDRNSSISANSQDQGNGGRVIVWADGINQFSGNITATGGVNSGNGGFVEISGKDTLIFRGNVDVSASQGIPGTILFDPKNITIANSGSDILAANDNFNENPSATVTFDADDITGLSGEVILEANNDIAVSEDIVTGSVSSLEMRAGRSINVNANIDTSGSNGNIILKGNNDSANVAQRDAGAANINMASGTTLNAGQGNVEISLGQLGQVGNITLDQVQGGLVNVNANGGNITQVNNDSLINASAVQLQTVGAGGIGLETEPLRLEANNLEATAGSGGAFFNVPNGDVTIGGVTDELTGMSITDGGDFRLEAVGNITVNEGISTATNSGNSGSITLASSQGGIAASYAVLDTHSVAGNAGFVTLNAFGDIQGYEISSYSQSSGRGGDISVTSENGGIYVNLLGSASVEGDGGLITLDAFGDIQGYEISSYSQSSGRGGDISVTSENGGIDVVLFYSLSLAGDGGTVTLNAEGNIQAESIYSYSEGNGEGGDISITSYSGGIGTNSLWINSSSVGGNGGSVILDALDGIQAEWILSAVGDIGQGGDISLTSQNGAIDVSLLESYSIAGDGGSVLLNAFENIQADSIYSSSYGSGQGGEVSLTSENGGISSNWVESYSEAGDGGAVTLNAENNIQTSWILSNSEGSGAGGDISLTSENGGISANWFDAYSVAGNGGNVTLNAFGNIQSFDISSYSEGSGKGGDISLTSQNGGIDVSLSDLNSYSVAGDGGSVTLNAAEDIQVYTISSSSDGSGAGGDISLTSENGGINTNKLDSSSLTGDGGAVTLNALGNIQTNIISSEGDNSGGNIQLSSGNSIYNSLMSSSSPNGTGGDITLTAGNAIATGNVISAGFEQGGNIALTTNFGDIDTSAGTLNAQAISENGVNGNITIAAHIGNITIGELNGPQNISINDGGTDNIWENNPSVSATADADNINSQTGQISIQAHNDINVNEAIVANSIESLALAAGRNININANIDTSGNNGNITLEANHNGADLNHRQPGTGNITMAPGTSLNSGSGNILLQLGTLAEVGNITLANLNTSGTVTVISPGGNIFSADRNSLITANGGTFQTYGSGGIGTATDPINITLNNLEASAGSGGAYFHSPNGAVTVGGASNNLSGISTSGGGAVSLTAAGNITVNEDISTLVSSGNAGNITLTSEDGAIHATGNLSSYTSQGNGGVVTMTAAGNITANDIQSFGSGGDGGAVTMTAEGEITVTGGIDSTGLVGDGGDVTMTAEGDIAIDGRIWTDAAFDGGSITLTSNTGEITTDLLWAKSFNGNAGAIAVTAAEDIRVRAIESQGNTRGGDITVTSNHGAVNTSEGQISAIAWQGQAGSVSLTAESSIQTAGIASFGGTGGGDITLTSDTGFIDTTQGRLDAYSSYGNGGSVVLRSPGEIRTSDIFASSGFEPTNILLPPSSEEIPDSTGNAGDITLESTNSAINTSAGILNSRSVGGSAGHINLNASSDIRTGFVVSSAGSAASSQGGDITITSHNGAINTTVGDLSAEAQIDPTDDVSVLETASIFENNSANLSAYSRGGTGGNVSLSAPGDITTSHISAFGPQGTGNVDLTSNNGAINTGAILSFSQAGNAGNVTLEAANDINTSHISAWGNQQGGNIAIESGGNFDIGEATIHSFSQESNAGDVQITTSGNTTLGGDTNRHGIRSAGQTEGGDITIRSYGNIDTTAGDLETYSETGTGGDVYLHADSSVNTQNIRTFGPVESGDITIISGDSSVNTASLETIAPNGTSGDININSFGTSGNIQTANLTSAGEDGSGNITVVAEDGSVITKNITSQATQGDSGDITVDGQDDVITGDITSQAGENSGDISVSSQEGSTTTGNVATVAQNGNSGDVTVTAQNDVATGNITSQAGQNSGNISVNSNAGSATTGNIATVAQNGNSGDVAVNAQNDVATGNITSQAGQNSGNILVSSNAGSATTGNIATVAQNGNSGDVTVTAQNDVATGNITSQAGQNSGNILVNSNAGSVTTGNIATVAENGNSGNIAVRANNDIYTLNISSIAAIDSGDISVTSDTGNINTANLETVAETGNSGDVDLTANQDINTGDISSIGGTNSGDISATSTEGAISTGDIETSAETGIAGDVTLNAQDDINTGSITSTGAISSGDITVNSAEGVVNTGEIYTDTGEINIHQGGLNSENTNSGLTNSISQDNLSLNPVFNPENHQNINDSDSEINLPQNLDNLQVFTSNILETSIEDRISTIEESRTSEFADFLGSSAENQVITTASAREILGSMAEQTGTQPAVVYVTAYDDQLELILFTADGSPIRAAVPEANRQALTKQVQEFRNEITDPRQRRSNSYLASAQQLYQWLIAPIEPQLQAAEIDTILFSMDAGLRGLPIAALYDGEQFLVEKYSLSLIPSVSLMDAHYQPLQGKKVLAMGADTFPDVDPLPGVSLELNLITQNLWRGTQLFNQDFTRENLQQEREHHGYEIVHLATHADFTPGENSQTYIYFWNDKLPLDDLRDLGLNNPATELLVLSACRTAVGDEMAELGFAGLAVRTGVKSALASLWYVSDEGTLGLMTEFYQFLHSAPIKAEALRQAQVAMIHNQVQVEGNELRGSKAFDENTLPPELVRLQNMNLSHPYFWSGFTMIGSPW